MAHFQQVLRSIQYTTTVAVPTLGTRVITFVSNDGTGDSLPRTTLLQVVKDNIAATLFVKRLKKKKVLFVRMTNARTGEVLQEIKSPYQKPTFAHIAVSVWDADGDGIPDTVVLTARKGKKRLSRQFPG